MNRLFIIFVAITFVTFPLAAQQGQILSDAFYSYSLDCPIMLYVYLPPDYSESGAPYPLLIDLHGGGGSNYENYSAGIKPFLDELISSGEIAPLIVIWPDIKCPELADMFNGHLYQNSILNGNYGDVISVDLIDWINESNYNISPYRENRAIGGFSMGGEGGMRLAIRNSDKFGVVASHDGAVSIYGFLYEIPYLLAEFPGGPPYEFSQIKGYYSRAWIVYSRIFSPNKINPNMPSRLIDFPLDSTGAIIDSVFYGRWIPENDPAALLQNPEIYQNEIAIYFDGKQEGSSYFNEPLHQDLLRLNIPHSYKMYPGGHGVSEESARARLRFLDSVFVKQSLHDFDLQPRMSAKMPSNINAYGNFIPEIILQNIGGEAAINAAISCQILNNGVPVYSDVATIDSLKPCNSVTCYFKSWCPGELNEFEILFISQFGQDENGLNDSLKTTLVTSELIDDFEQNLYKWNIHGGWNLSEEPVFDGEYCLNSSTNPAYPTNGDSRIEYYTGFNLSQLKNARLTYQSLDFIEEEHDFGYVEISIDSGQTWQILGEPHTGNSNQWQEQSRSLETFCGKGFEDMRLAFHFVSDSVKSLAGWFLDNIKLESLAPTEVAEPNQSLPDHPMLFANYPNPFNPQTVIRYYLPQKSIVKLTLYNLLGQKITTLVDQNQLAGEHKICWNGIDASGMPVTSGVYLFKLEANGYSRVRKLLLLK